MRVLDPAGTFLSGGGCAGHSNFIGETPLATTGTYTLDIYPLNGNTGSLTLSMSANPVAPAGTPQVRVGDPAVDEGNGATTALTFTLIRTGDLSATSTVKYKTADGTAKAAAGDYLPVLTPTLVTFVPGADTATVTVTVNGDTLDEPHETLFLSLPSPTNAILTDTKATGVITNDDGAGGASFSVGDLAVAEGNGGPTSSAFVVTRSGPTAETSTVVASVKGQTASAGTDYNSTTPVTLTFAPGETSKSVPFEVLGDPADEPNETLVANLSKAVNATIADKSGTATIVDDDGGPAVPPVQTYLSVDDVSVLEGDAGTTDLVFEVTRTGGTTGTSTVRVSTADGTAQAPGDYATVPLTTVTFNPGDTAKLVTVSVNGDATGEVHETLTLRLSSATGAVIVDTAGLGTITNDDGGSAQLSVSDVTVNEGGAGTTALAGFVITRDGDASEEVTVTVKTADKTAKAADYQAVMSAVVTLGPGVTSATVLVTVNGDATVEPDETFQLKLTKATLATIVDSAGTATILNDDS